MGGDQREWGPARRRSLLSPRLVGGVRTRSRAARLDPAATRIQTALRTYRVARAFRRWVVGKNLMIESLPGEERVHTFRPARRPPKENGRRRCREQIEMLDRRNPESDPCPSMGEGDSAAEPPRRLRSWRSQVNS